MAITCMRGMRPYYIIAVLVEFYRVHRTIPGQHCLVLEPIANTYLSFRQDGCSNRMVLL